MNATLRRIMLALLAWFFGAASRAARAASFAHGGWNELLSKHVVSQRGGRATQVDYAGFKAGRASLKQYLSSTTVIAKPAFDNWRKPEAARLDARYRAHSGGPKTAIAFLDYEWQLNSVTQSRPGGKP